MFKHATKGHWVDLPKANCIEVTGALASSVQINTAIIHPTPQKNLNTPIFAKNSSMAKEQPDEFYARLKEQLLEHTSWPSNYLYKFIVPTDEHKIAQIHEIFSNTGAVIELKKSKKGTYTSVSVTVYLKNPDEVIAKYKEVAVVEGVISL